MIRRFFNWLSVRRKPATKPPVWKEVKLDSDSMAKSGGFAPADYSKGRIFDEERERIRIEPNEEDSIASGIAAIELVSLLSSDTSSSDSDSSSESDFSTSSDDSSNSDSSDSYSGDGGSFDGGGASGDF